MVAEVSCGDQDSYEDQREVMIEIEFKRLDTRDNASSSSFLR